MNRKECRREEREKEEGRKEGRKKRKTFKYPIMGYQLKKLC